MRLCGQSRSSGPDRSPCRRPERARLPHRAPQPHTRRVARLLATAQLPRRVPLIPQPTQPTPPATSQSARSHRFRRRDEAHCNSDAHPSRRRWRVGSHPHPHDETAGVRPYWTSLTVVRLLNGRTQAVFSVHSPSSMDDLEDEMPSNRSGWSRERVERGIYLQPNGVYSVCVMIDGKARFRAVDARTIEQARRQRELLRRAAREHLLPASPRLTFGEIARRWLCEFEAKVAAGERREPARFSVYRWVVRCCRGCGLRSGCAGRPSRSSSCNRSSMRFWRAGSRARSV